VSLPVKKARNTDTIFVDKLIHKRRVTGEENNVGCACLIFLGGVFLLAYAGCNKPNVAAVEKRERDSPLYRKAREAERAGDIKGAVRLYQNVLVEEPRAFSAHFQLNIIYKCFALCVKQIFV